MEQILRPIAERIQGAQRVAIFTHTRPDGDALGSALALACALEKLGLECEVCVDTPIPTNLAFIEGVKRIKRASKQPFDLLITVDCSDEQRLGELSEAYFVAVRRNKIDAINIDHHVSNTRFAKYNFLRICAANCINVAALISYLGVSFDKKMAEYLLIGLLTDSGNFSHDDVDEECLSLAASFVKAGADIRYLNYHLFKKQSKERAALYARTMEKIRYYHDGRFSVIVITKENMELCNANDGMTEGFVDFPLNVDGVEVAASLLEVKKGQYRISLRSKEYADVNKIAGVYGGGGHVRAAGCMLFGDLEEVLDKLSYTVSQYLE